MVICQIITPYGAILKQNKHGLFKDLDIKYSIKNGVNGYLADNLDVVDFANKIVKIIHDSKERQRLQQGIKFILSEDKTEVDFKKAVESFYSDLLLS